MEISPLLFFLAALGFGAYEVGIRIIDNNTKWVTRIGWKKYLLYLAIYGGATVVVAANFAHSFLPTEALSQAFAVLFGLGMPSTLRVFAEVVTKLVYEKAKGSFLERSADQPPNHETPKDAEAKASRDGRTDTIRMEEVREVVPRYSHKAYAIGDFFGFGSRLK